MLLWRHKEMKENKQLNDSQLEKTTGGSTNYRTFGPTIDKYKEKTIKIYEELKKKKEN